MEDTVRLGKQPRENLVYFNEHEWELFSRAMAELANTNLKESNTSFIAMNLFHQASGNAYTFEEVRAWAKEAGFSKQTLKKLNAPGFGLIVCEK